MWEKFFKFVGVPGVIALVVVGAVVGLAIDGREIPDLLARLAVAAVGFYLGGRSGVLVQDVALPVLGFTGWDWQDHPAARGAWAWDVDYDEGEKWLQVVTPWGSLFLVRPAPRKGVSRGH